MTQEEALAILKTGVNVFLTGEPGAGKTYTVHTYVAWLRAHDIEPAITASTGIAATHIGGMTIHSWSGIGVAGEINEAGLAVIGGNAKVRRRVAHARVLIIDEISMLSGTTLSMVDVVCRRIRGNSFPFGGMQVVFVGDFFQLPPVVRGGQAVSFAYESEAWRRLNPDVCYLREQHRQNDPAFMATLVAIRKNQCGDHERVLLESRICQADTVPEDIPKLFPHNVDVDRINFQKLARLPGAVSLFTMETYGPRPLVEFLKKSCLSPETLELKRGATVMFTKNSREGKFVNGTLGVVVGFDAGNGDPLIRTRDGRTIRASAVEWVLEEGGKVKARVAQVPLRLAWAITVHKSQGMSMDGAAMDLSRAFEYGQGYVALSRVRSFEGLYLLGLNERALAVHPGVAAEDGKFRSRSEEAVRRLGTADPRSRAEAHANFIRACGGTVVPKRRVSFEPRVLSTYEKTRELALQGISLDEIAAERNLAVETIIAHLEKLAMQNIIDPHRDLSHLKLDKNRFEKIKNAFVAAAGNDGSMFLAPVRALLGDSFSYEELRLARLFLK